LTARAGVAETASMLIAIMGTMFLIIVPFIGDQPTRRLLSATWLTCGIAVSTPGVPRSGKGYSKWV
jgi:hypothetical protein